MKLKVDSVELYCEVHGDGEPIVFVHGWMDDSSVWRSQIEFFAKKYKVIVYDHRGHGNSDKPAEGYSIQTLSNDLCALMRKLNLERVFLVGHSMGGMVAMQFTLDRPDMVRKLVLVGTTAKNSLSTRVFLWIMLHILSYESFARRGIDLKYYKPSEQVKREALDRALKTPRYAALKSFPEWSKNFDMREQVSKIKVPALIVAGDRDRATPVGLSRFLNEKIEGSKMKVIHDCNHMVMIDKSGEFNAVLSEFFFK